MGLLDRMIESERSYTSQALPTPQQSSISEQDDAPRAPRPAVLDRVEVVLEYFLGNLKKGDAKSRKVAKLIEMIAKEAIEDIADVPDTYLEPYLQQSAGLFYWASTGERVVNIPLPEGFQFPDHLLSDAERDAIAAKPDPEAIDAAQRAEVKAIENGNGRASDMVLDGTVVGARGDNPPRELSA